MGPPSAFALSTRPWLLLILVLQTVVCALRMVVLLDIIGGFLMAIMIGLGFYGWEEGMDITMICYWGMLCLVNGAFDLAKVIDYTVKLPKHMPVFSSKLSQEYNLKHGVMWAIPIVTLLGAPLGWWLYKDYTEGGIIA